MVVVAREGRLLEAAALARPNGTSEGTVHSDNLSFRIELLDSHLVRMTWSKTETAAKAGVLERMEDLSVTHKVLEFGFGFTSQNLLAPSSLGLAHLKLVKACHVRLEGFRATFHLVGLHVARSVMPGREKQSENWMCSKILCKGSQARYALEHDLVVWIASVSWKFFVHRALRNDESRSCLAFFIIYV